MKNLYKTTDVKEFSKAFGSIGMNRARIIIVQQQAANQNELEVIPVRNINISLVKMIDHLTELDGYLKQKLDNQKTIDKNIRMSERESQIENTPQKPEVIQKDAEKVSGSSAGLGLLGVGALGLLAFEPVREAVGSLVGLATDAGKFATGVLGSINSLFSSMFSGTPDTITTQSNSEGGGVAQSKAPAPVIGGENTTESVSVPQAIAEQKPSFVASTLTGALVGGAAGSILPGVGSGVGAIAGAAYGAYKHFTTPPVSTSTNTGPTSTQSTGGTTTTTPAINQTKSESESKQQPGVEAGQIPKNDIVALGNYLISKGAERHKLQHPAFGPVGKHSKNSRHYRGMAIDVNFPGPNEPAILDALEPQLRAAGYNTIWRKAGHTTHMHVSVGGPEGKGGISSYGDASSMAGSGIVGEVASTVTAGIEETAKILGTVAGALVGKTTLKSLSTPLPDMSAFIQENSIQEKVALVQSKQPKTMPKPAPPNININKGGTIQNPPTMSDRNRLYYYIDRFDFDDVNKPTLVKSLSA